MADQIETKLVFNADTKFAVSEIERLNKMIGKMEKESKETVKAMRNLEKTVKQTGVTSKEIAASFKSVGQAAAGFSSSLKGLVAAYASIQGAQQLVGTMAELEDGFTGVAKTTGMTGEAFAKFKDDLLDLSTQMAGVSTEELQGIAETAGQLGIQGSDDILSFTETVAKMAVATDLSAEGTATAFAKISNATGEPISNVNRLGSTIDQLSNTTAALSSQIVDVTQRFAGIGKTAGLSTADILALSTAMINLGGSAETSGSALSTIFGQMMAKSKEFASVSGKSLDEWSQLMRDKPTEALKIFLAELSKMDTTDQINTLKKLGLGSVNTSAAVLKLSGNIGLLDKVLKEANAEWERATALNKEYEAASQSLNAQWEQTKNMLKALVVKLSDALLPAIKDANKAFQDWVSSLDKEQVKAYADEIASLVTGFAKVAGAIGGFIAKMASFVADYPKTSLALLALYKSLGGLSVALASVTGGLGGAAGKMPAMAAAGTNLSGAMGILRGAIGAVTALLGPGGALIAGAFAAATLALDAYTDSVKKDTEANKQQAAAMEQHATKIDSISDSYLKAQEEIAKTGTVSQATHDQIKQGLEEEIASIEKQLAAWEQNTNSTEEQNRAAMQLAGTLGQLKAQLDTLDADYSPALTLDDSEFGTKIAEDERKIDSVHGTATMDADTSAADAKISAVGDRANSTRGTARVDADTSAADTKISAVGTKANSTRGTAKVDADTSAADAKIQSVGAKANSTSGTAKVSADTADADGKIDGVKEEIDGLEGTARIDADTSAADSAIDAIASRGDSTSATVRIDGDNTGAMVSIGGATSTADHTVGTVKIHADASQANSVIHSLERTTSSTHIIHVRKVYDNAEGGYIDAYASGGMVAKAAARFDAGGRVPGYDPTDSDTVNAHLTRGEYVIRRKAVDYYSPSLFEALNRMRLPKFAEGGAVGSVTPASIGSQSVLNFHFDGKKFSLSGNQYDAEGVAKALQHYLEVEGGL